MLVCKKCNADLSNGEVKQGISKDKTLPDGTFRAGGKPYKYVQCNCGGREFLPFGVSEKKPTAPVAQAPKPSVTPEQFKLMCDTIGVLGKKIDQVLNVVNAMNAKQLAKEVGGEVVDPEDIAWEEN